MGNRLQVRRSAKGLARRAGARALRAPAARRAALRLAGARDHGLVLLYHRVSPDGPQPDEMVTTLLPQTLRAHLEAVGEMADIVGLDRLVAERGTGRLRVAVTFDDDDPRFVDHVLPLLGELGVVATFFLSGRTLHGLGPYWWELVEAEIADVGLAAAARRRGSSAATGAALARAIIDGTVPELADQAYAGAIRQLQPDEMRRIAAAGMTVGWHTLTHPSLPTLGDEQLAAALRDGRDALAAAVGQPLNLFAYPYARFDARSVAAARAAGLAAAFTGIGAPVTPAADRWQLGRYEPRTSDMDVFVAELALRAARLGSGQVL